MIVLIIFGALISLLILMEVISMTRSQASVKDIEEKMDETEELMSRTEHKTRITISSDDDDDYDDENDYFDDDDE